jgi:hypothetical protein
MPGITYDTNTGLPIPDLAYRGYSTYTSQWPVYMGTRAGVGRLNLTKQENPSATLIAKCTPGFFSKVDGTIGTVAAALFITLPASSTSYVWLNEDGTIHSDTAGYPSPATNNFVQLGVVVTGATTITSISSDDRIMAQSAGLGMTGVFAPTGASYLVMALSGSLSAERVLTQGAGILITDGGANGAVTVALDTPVTVARGGTGSANAAGARTNLGLIIGSDVQAFDTDLNAIAGLSPSLGRLIAGSGTAFVGFSVGTDGFVIVADSTQAAGLRWAKRDQPGVTKTAAYTATDADYCIFGDTTGGAFTITLPTAVGRTDKEFVIKQIGSATALTVGGGGVNIDGAATKVYAAQNEVHTYKSNGSVWFIVGN